MFVCFVGIINIKNDVIWVGKHFPLIVNAHYVDKRGRFLGEKSRYIFILLYFNFRAEAREHWSLIP